MFVVYKKRKLNLSIVDYGMGNTGSIKNAFKAIGVSARVALSIDELYESDGIILPGVGAFGDAMRNIRKFDLFEPLNDLALKVKKPILGICLGQQIMAHSSEEDESVTGFGWIDGQVRRFDPTKVPSIPHVGWSDVTVTGRDEVLFHEAKPEDKYYFTHSFALYCNPSSVGSLCQYGGEFVASVRKENIFATQFHPEKSQFAGSRILRNFAAFCSQKAIEDQAHAQ